MVQIQVYKESNITDYVIIILFVYISLNMFQPVKENELHFTQALNRYCRHCVTNISQCKSINRNKKTK